MYIYIPRDLSYSTIVSISKYYRASLCDVDNYRGIALFNCICKLYDYVIIDVCEPQLRTSNLQFGFKENHSTILCSLMYK